VAAEALGTGNKARKKGFKERSRMGLSQYQTGQDLSLWTTYFGAKDDANLLK
jgi:hypothetical protein